MNIFQKIIFVSVVLIGMLFVFPSEVYAAATPGDYLTRRNSASTTEVTTAGLVVGWDAPVASNGSSISYDSDDMEFTLASGRYLVMWSERVDADDTIITNNFRTEVNGRLLVNGVATTTGAGAVYHRNSDINSGDCSVVDCQFNNVLSGAGIIVVYDDGTTLSTHLQRTDSTGASQNVDRVSDWGGISILAIDDTWDYSRYSLSTNTVPLDTFGNVVWDRTDEEETGFSMTSGRITITDAGRYLISYSIPMRVSSGNRTAFNSRIRRNDTTAIAGTVVNAYPRNQQGANDHVLSYVGVVDLSASDVIDVETDMTDGTLASNLMLAGSSLQILKLPVGNETFIFTGTAGNCSPSTITEYAWASTPHVDTGGFTDTSDTDAIIEPAVDGDYLFFATQWTSGATRRVPTGRFSVDDVIVTHAAGGTYTRNTATDGGYSFGALITGLTTGNDISLENIGIAELNTATCSNSGMSGIRLGSIFSSTAAPTVDTDAATSVTNTTATINGDITATGGENANERGFAWGTNSGLSGGDTATTTEFGDFGTGTFSDALSSLDPSTTYYFRAFAANTVGTSTGSILNFTTTSGSTPAGPVGEPRTLRFGTLILLFGTLLIL